VSSVLDVLPVIPVALTVSFEVYQANVVETNVVAHAANAAQDKPNFKPNFLIIFFSFYF
jgi:hypothetical protein